MVLPMKHQIYIAELSVQHQDPYIIDHETLGKIRIRQYVVTKNFVKAIVTMNISHPYINKMCDSL